MRTRIAITPLLLLTSTSLFAESIADTPENREREAARYVETMSPRDLFRDAAEKAAASLPAGDREQFKGRLAERFDFVALASAMKASMVKYFTAEELKALADLYSSPVGKSAKGKFGAYMADVGAAMQAEMSKARATIEDGTRR